jgi:hypothetical protein
MNFCSHDLLKVSYQEIFEEMRQGGQSKRSQQKKKKCGFRSLYHPEVFGTLEVSQL